MRKTISELKSKIKILEKANAAAAVAAAPAPAAEPADSSQIENTKVLRITAERITAWRKKLGLNCAQYAKLLDVSPLSVCHWENGKTTPREAQKKRIAELRDMGKRELKKLCDEKGIKLRKAK